MISWGSERSEQHGIGSRKTITQVLRFAQDDKFLDVKRRGGGHFLPPPGFSDLYPSVAEADCLPGVLEARLTVVPSPMQHLYAALLGPLLSIVFCPALWPAFTLICLGLASAFLGRVIFKTPLS